jgi:hypothetical protein
MVPVKLMGDAALHAFIANHMITATKATTIEPHTTGVIRFEPPLRGESLAAWLNSVFTSAPFSGLANASQSTLANLSEHGEDLVPKRSTFPIAIRLRW